MGDESARRYVEVAPGHEKRLYVLMSAKGDDPADEVSFFAWCTAAMEYGLPALEAAAFPDDEKEDG